MKKGEWKRMHNTIEVHNSMKNKRKEEYQKYRLEPGAQNESDRWSTHCIISRLCCLGWEANMRWCVEEVYTIFTDLLRSEKKSITSALPYGFCIELNLNIDLHVPRKKTRSLLHRLTWRRWGEEFDWNLIDSGSVKRSESDTSFFALRLNSMDWAGWVCLMFKDQIWF